MDAALVAVLYICNFVYGFKQEVVCGESLQISVKGFAVKHKAGPRKKSKFRVHAFNLKASSCPIQTGTDRKQIKKQTKISQ